jgi:hypothetical protein
VIGGDRPFCAILSSKAVQSSNLLRLCGSSNRAARYHISPESEVFTMHGKYLSSVNNARTAFMMLVDWYNVYMGYGIHGGATLLELGAYIGDSLASAAHGYGPCNSD